MILFVESIYFFLFVEGIYHAQCLSQHGRKRSKSIERKCTATGMVFSLSLSVTGSYHVTLLVWNILDQADLKTYRDLLASNSQVLELKACAVIPGQLTFKQRLLSKQSGFADKLSVFCIGED